MEPIWLILCLLVGVALGAALGVLATRARTAAAEARVTELRSSLHAQEARQREEAHVLREITPVRDQLQQLRETVQELEAERLELHGRLSEQLRSQAQSDAELRAATEQLAASMRSSSARGNWGEAQLRNLLEATGMLEHVDFDTQVTVVSGSGGSRPDALVHLPGEHELIIDAKAPMARYLDALAVPTPGNSADEKRRKRLLQDHARALSGHVDALRARDYPASVTGSARLVVAYLPSEAALSAAVDADPALLDYAFSRDVALASPTTLWAILRAVAAAWQQERVSDSVAEVLELSSELYRRIATASGHLAKLGRQLHSSVDAYDQLIGSLEARVLPAARRLAEFDAAAPELADLPRIGVAPRSLAAPEFTSGAASSQAISSQALSSQWHR